MLFCGSIFKKCVIFYYSRSLLSWSALHTLPKVPQTLKHLRSGQLAIWFPLVLRFQQSADAVLCPQTIIWGNPRPTWVMFLLSGTMFRSTCFVVSKVSFVTSPLFLLVSSRKALLELIISSPGRSLPSFLTWEDYHCMLLTQEKTTDLQV